jgi:amino acid transporter
MGNNHPMLLLLAGFGMIAMTVAVHTLGATLWLQYTGRRLRRLEREKKLPHLFTIIATTATVYLSLHLLEALLWAILFMRLPDQAGLGNLHEAFYFSMITFTTLGYGDVTLSREWYVLAGMEGMVGIIVFGLSTAMLFAIIQKSWKIKHPKSD